MLQLLYYITYCSAMTAVMLCLVPNTSLAAERHFDMILPAKTEKMPRTIISLNPFSVPFSLAICCCTHYTPQINNHTICRNLKARNHEICSTDPDDNNTTTCCKTRLGFYEGTVF